MKKYGNKELREIHNELKRLNNELEKDNITPLIFKEGVNKIEEDLYEYLYK